MIGTFISFEGIDGSGKSTQLRLLANILRAQGHELVVTREPGGTPLGLRLREALLDSQEHVDPLTELLVFAADRAQHVRTILRPALAAGKIVLTDRYADATRAYQGAGRGFAPELIAEVVKLATDGLEPDLTLLFDLPPAEGVARTRRRTNGKDRGDRLDSEAEDFHVRVREAYLRIAAAEPERVRLIDTNRTVDATHTQVKEIVKAFLAGRGINPQSPPRRSGAGKSTTRPHR